MTKRVQAVSYKSVRESFPLKPLVGCMRLALAGGLLASGVLPAKAELPIPVPGSGFVTHGVGGIDPSRSNDHTMVIDQKSNKAIYNWQKFNVGKDDTVNFDLPDGSSVALNKIFQGSPSQILGHISSDAQAYLVNRNGIVFGKDSVVDTKALVASSLNIADDVFKRGIIREFEKDSGPGQAALNGQTGDASTQVDKNSSIVVEAGAKIHVDKNGQVILAAPTVTNAGSISADEKGQIIMVASQDKVYLQPASSNSPFAGLLVEVGSGGKVENQAGGDISVRQGNVTLAGYAVNQAGRISSTTSVNVNGSIRLLAREKAVDDVFAGTHKLRATKTERSDGSKAQVTFSAGSSTEIQADGDGATAYDEQVQKQSLIEVSSHDIAMEKGSSIVAPSAKVTMTATNNLADPLLGNRGRVFIDDGAKIDVSGKKNVEVAMERNVAEISVQTYNLRDAPYQKGGVLQGAKVKVDTRNSTEILDASGGAAIKRGIDERMTQGGEIDLTSSGEVIVNSGAQFDISGGSLRYRDGYVNTSKLVDKAGRLVDISDADPEEKYVKFYGTIVEQHTKWAQNKSWNMLGNLGMGRFEKGYVEGKDAGSLNIQSPKTAWAGKLIAGSEQGIYQRNNPAFGGAFTINKADNTGSRADLFFSDQNLSFQKDAPLQQLAVGQAFPDAANGGNQLILSTDAIKESGISELTVKVGGNASIDAGVAVELPAFGQLSLDAKQIDVAGSVYTAGGNIRLNSIKDLNLHNGAELDASGRWVNDYLEEPGQEAANTLAINGGSITVNARENLNFAEAASIKADGGAWLNSAGKLIAGNGGSIKLAAGVSGVPGVARVDGKLSAFSLGKGGKLTLASSNINVGGNVVDSNALNLLVHDGEFDFATQMGFAELNLLAANKITVKGDTDLSLTTQNRLLDNDYRSKASDKSIAAFSSVRQLDESLRKPLKLGLNGATGVDIETGSRIEVDKGSSIDIQTSNAGKGIYIDGSLVARGYRWKGPVASIRSIPSATRPARYWPAVR